MCVSFRIIGRACVQWSANGDSRLGAALAYYALFSLAPLLILTVSIAGAVFGEDAARGKIEEHLMTVVGAETAKSVQQLVEGAARSNGSSMPSVSMGLLIVGALGTFLHMRSSFCIIWKLEPPRGSDVLGFFLNYFIALFMILVFGILLVASLATQVVVSLCEPWLAVHFPAVPWQSTEILISFVLLTFLFATLYRILSGWQIPWVYVWYGAFVTAILFTLGKTAIGWYLATTSLASTYGAASSLVGLLIWVYYSSQILFFGAELVQARRTRSEWLTAGTTENAHVTPMT